MPEPLLYLKAMAASVIVSAVLVLAMTGRRCELGRTRLNLTSVLAVAGGLVIGYFVLSLQLAWPPKNGLDRLLLVVVPAAMIVESIATFERVPRWFAWLLRIGLAVIVPRVLLHDSVYLSGAENDWPVWQLGLVLAAGGALLAAVWGLLFWLSERSPGASIPIAIGLATQIAGITVMLAGYIKGGAAAIPLAAVSVSASVAFTFASKRAREPRAFSSPAILSIGVVGLFGLLFIGRFFGRISTDCALVILLAPLLCWATEIPSLRHRGPWLVGAIRLALVAIPLVVVLVLAKRKFDRDMAPLLGEAAAFVEPGVGVRCRPICTHRSCS